MFTIDVLNADVLWTGQKKGPREALTHNRIMI